MRGVGGASGRNRARDEEPPDEALIIEPLDPARAGAARGGRLRGWFAARLAAGPSRRLAPRARALRAGMVVTLIAVALFVMLGGPALVGAGWARVTAALTGAALIPSLTMTAWQAASGPLGELAGTVTYTPDPGDPARVYACQADGARVTIWRTLYTGRAWRSALEITTSPPASSCQVKVALDAPHVAIVVIHPADLGSPGCERLTVYGVTVAPGSEFRLPTTPGACLGNVWPSAHALYYWWTNAAGGQALTGFARSDDLGATWRPIPLFPLDPHFSLAPALLDSGSADTILTQVYEWPGPNNRGARNEVYRSLDGGFSWRRALNAPLGAHLYSTTEPGALTDARWPPTYAEVYNGGQLSPPWVPDYEPAAIQALQPDGSTWKTLPPLPLPTSGAQIGPAPLGISAALTVGPGGALLALGEQPGATATLAPPRQLWLWAWDPAIHKWRAGLAAPDGASLAGITWAAGPAEGPYAKTSGAYLWLSDSRDALYWTFIPDAQA